MSKSPARTPTLWIIAGANGSGKTSAYGRMAVDEPAGSIWIINPDELAKRISEQEKLSLNPEANVEAVRRIEAWLYASVKAHQTIGVETVLSTSKYRKLVKFAREHGFKVRLIYVLLETADLNVERVRIRVSKGGHAVDETKIRERRTRSFEQFAWFLAEADRTDVFDNSGAEPKLLLTWVNGVLHGYGTMIEELQEAVAKAFPHVAWIFDKERTSPP